MIFAHGAVGFLTLLCTRKVWKARPSERQWWTALIVAGVGGMFPDVDLFYTHIIDASVSHRLLPTHTPVVYITLALVGSIIAQAVKRPHWKQFIVAFCVGALSHTVVDGIMGNVMYFYPFSRGFYGLSDINADWLTMNLIFINFLVEGIAITIFFLVLISLLTNTSRQRRWWAGVTIAFFGIGLSALVVISQHVYNPPYYTLLGDLDHDGITNVSDLDMDGDGQENSSDLDADNDGKSNTLEIMEYAEHMEGVWQDPTNGGLVQIPVRVGFVTNNDMVRLLFQSAGVMVPQAMKKDYAINSSDYASAPQHDDFDRTNQNVYAWLLHNNRLETGDALAQGREQIGDILFFTSGRVAVVTGFDTKGVAQILDVAPGRRVQERTLNEITAVEGVLVARGKMLDATPLYGNANNNDASR